MFNRLKEFMVQMLVIGDKRSAGCSPSVPVAATNVPVQESIPALPLSSPMPTLSKRDEQIVIDAPGACAAYLNYLQTEFGEGEMLWKPVFQIYCRLARDRGWPDLSEKALSQGLTSLGCKSRQRDLRSEGKGRPRELVWPGSSAGSSNIAA